MSLTKSFVLLAGAALSLGGFNTALAQQSSPDEIRAVVAEMLNDSETRSSLLADAGHDHNGFMITGEGFTLRIGGQIQFRYVLNFNDESGNDDGFEPGFQTRRTKLWFTGNISEKWKYRIQGAFERSGGSFTLEDAYVMYDFGSGFYTKFGQFKLAFLREENISGSRQLAAERSLANEQFNQDWSQGVEVGYKADQWRFAVAFSDGFASRNTDFTANNGVTEADWALTGRAEFAVVGPAAADWDEYWSEFTAEKGSKFGVLLGAAAHYQESANTANPADVDLKYFGYTADVSFKGDGWNAFAAFMGRHVDTRSAGPDPEFDDFGAVAQFGIRVAPNTELFARWDAIFLDGDRPTPAGTDDDFHFATLGVNQYFAGHAAKATADVVYGFNKTSPNFGLGNLFANGGGLSSTGTGFLSDSDDGQVVIRLQFQLLF